MLLSHVDKEMQTVCVDGRVTTYTKVNTGVNIKDFLEV